MDNSAFPRYESRANLILQINPDCTKFCPVTVCSHILAVGLYELNEKEQKAYGGVKFYDTKSNQLKLIDESINSAGVLDMDWLDLQLNNYVFLITACCDSYVRLYGINTENYKSSLIQEYITEPQGKCLKIESSVVSNQIYIVTSMESGAVFYFILDKDFKVIEQVSTKQHAFSAWSCGISKFQPNVFLSGSDDQKLIIYDKRKEGNYIAQINKSTHQMGICCISCCPYSEYNFLTGSYDEYIRLWDMRNIKSEVVQSKRNGGVWRCEWRPDKKNVVLCGIYSSQYFEILQVDQLSQQEPFQQIQKFDGHYSLAYACHYSLDCKQIVTCSFYDKKLQLWSL